MATLYVVGIGPGDPELITLKGMRVLETVPCIFVPRGTEEGPSLARSIIEGVLDISKKKVVEAYFPMKKTKGGGRDLKEKWDEIAMAVKDYLDKGMDVAFTTLGDPGFYSTYFYLHKRFQDPGFGHSIEIIPGVSSINAAAARAGDYLALGDEKVAILPANYMFQLGPFVREFETLVLLKVHKVFRELTQALEETGTFSKVIYVCKVGMDGEKVITDLRSVRDEDLDYFSMVIVKR